MTTFRSEFWNENGGTYSLISGRMPRRNSIRRVVNRDGFRALQALFDALIGDAPGGAATAQHTRVGNTDSNTASNNEPRIVTVTSINRNTATADVTTLKEMVFNVRTRPPYPADRSGNGGPALP